MQHPATPPNNRHETELEEAAIQDAARKWDRYTARRALDELFVHAKQYRSTEAYHELLQFVARFRGYSPFNAMLVHAQMQGARFVAPASRWMRDYRHRIHAGARPLVILQPMGPIMFVFDVSDTVPEPDAPPLPRKVTNPFDVRKGQIGSELEETIANAVRDGIEVRESKLGSQGAGSVRTVQTRQRLRYVRKLQPSPEYVEIPHRYDLVLAEGRPAEVRYDTLVHELAHLYCGHLGTPNPSWWPDRRFLDLPEKEFEAESVSFLVCGRLGLETRAEEYLAGYVRDHVGTPEISLECVLKAAGLIERMGCGRMPPRREN